MEKDKVKTVALTLPGSIIEWLDKLANTNGDSRSKTATKILKEKKEKSSLETA